MDEKHKYKLRCVEAALRALGHITVEIDYGDARKILSFGFIEALNEEQKRLLKLQKEFEGFGKGGELNG